MTDWEQILKKHGQVVWNTAYRLLGNEADVADCFQETLISAIELSRRQSVRNIAALLVSLATAKAIDRLRKRFRESSHNAVDRSGVQSLNPGPVEVAESRELANSLRKALTQLPAQESEVFCMRFFNGMSYRQISTVLGIKTNAVGVSLNRARTKLRTLLKIAAN